MLKIQYALKILRHLNAMGIIMRHLNATGTLQLQNKKIVDKLDKRKKEKKVKKKLGVLGIEERVREKGEKKKKRRGEKIRGKWELNWYGRYI